MGNRHRSQATKFLKRAKTDSGFDGSTLIWAEQSALQAILHDFTNEANWTVLAEIKEAAEDEQGMRALLQDLFTVLGRDPLMVESLHDIDMISSGRELLTAALENDPLDPDIWVRVCGSELQLFEERFMTLDLSDPRANILFGRRLERVRLKDEEAFIRMVTRLLAQRPHNHEAWIELGRLHESRKEYDEAWFCYDQSQTVHPTTPARDQFKSRMEKRLDGNIAWKTPTQELASKFQTKMKQLAMRGQMPEGEELEKDAVEPTVKDELEMLLENGEFSAAFFLARKELTAGGAWAEEYLLRAEKELNPE